MRTSRRIFLKSAVGLTGAATAFHASAATAPAAAEPSAPSATANSLILKATLTTP